MYQINDSPSNLESHSIEALQQFEVVSMNKPKICLNVRSKSLKHMGLPIGVTQRTH